MASTTILSDNGVSSGSAGIKTTGGNDGVLALQTTTSGGTATTAVTIDTSQNVGIGVTPSAWQAGRNIIELGGSVTGQVVFNGSSNNGFIATNVYNSGSGNLYKNSNYATSYNQSSGQHQWYTAASGTAGNAITFTQAMTLDASGNLLVGTTAFGNSSGGVQLNSGAVGAQLKTSATVTSTWNHYQIYNANGNVGSISTSGSTTTYSTSSDYRLKEDVAPMTGALARVAALKPVTYKWKTDGSDGEGFIAHELAEVVPECVVGEKDAVETYTDADGNEQTRPKYQGIDTSFLVATLTAAIQEQNALIQTLTERVSALENK